MTGKDEAPEGGRLTIDLAALVANYRLLVEQAPAPVAAVVKADAYGLGVDAVAPALAVAGCRTFFVAHLSEAAKLVSLLPLEARIFVLNGLAPGRETACAGLGAVPVLNSLEQARRWSTLADTLGRRLPAAIQVDSGMSRLGLSPDEVEMLAASPHLLAPLDVRLVMSHLACADDPASPANAPQHVRFAALAARLPAAPWSLANSGGLFLAGGYAHDLARAGIALYGGAPQGGSANPMRAVVSLDARVIQIRSIGAGEGVGYGLSFIAETPRRLATIAVGYADGWPRALGNRGAAYVGRRRVPIVGRVSMDSIILDVTDVPEQTLAEGDSVELLGPHQSIDDVAADAGTIAYEILTNLGRRYERRYRPAADASAARTGP